MQHVLLRGALCIFTLSMLCAFAPTPIGATTPADCTVTTNADSGGGSLRACIAQVGGSLFTIDFDMNQVVSPIVLSSPITMPPTDVTINGPGANLLAIDGGNPHQNLFLLYGSGITLRLNDLTFQNMSTAVHGRFGGTARISRCVFDNPTSPGDIFSIFSVGPITVSQSVFKGYGAAIASGLGGVSVTDSTLMTSKDGIIDSSELILQSTGVAQDGFVGVFNSTISNYDSFGIQTGESGSLTMANSTIMGGSGAAAAVAPMSGSLIKITNSTLTNNSHGVTNDATLKNTIVAGNSIDLDLGHAYAGNNNLIGGSGPTFGTNNLFNANPRLDSALRDNNTGIAPADFHGVQTLALLPGSQAIGAGDSAACADTLFGGTGGIDERGVPRPATGCDIGAFQSRGFAIAATGGDGQTGIGLQAFPNPLIATVTSAAGDPVAGASVTFTAPPSGPSATFSPNADGTAIVAADGTARITAIANATRGGYTVSANITGATSGAVNFSLANLGVGDSLYIVDNTGNGTGSGDQSHCPAGGGSTGTCTLRDALAAAGSGTDTITFKSGLAGPITITSPLTIGTSVTITGPSTSVLAIDGGGSGTLFKVTAPATLTINTLTLRNSTTAIDNTGTFQNGGTINVTRTSIINNGTGIVTYGGAVNVDRSFLSNNTSASGGAIFLPTGSSDPVTVKNSTFTGNSFAIYGNNATVINSTIVDNHSGLFIFGTLTMTNSIAARNNLDGPTLDFLLGSGDYNLIGNTNGLGFSGTGNITDVDPVLDTVPRTNGATDGTMTVAVLPGSPAIGAGGGTGACGTIDARGVSRPATGCDIGSFQTHPFTVVATSGASQSTPINQAFGNPLVATVTSTAGEPVAGGGSFITFTTPGTNASATLSGTPAGKATITGASGASSGTAQVTATANGTSGVYTVIANLPGAASGGASFTLSNTGIPNSITVNSGTTPQNAPIGTAYGTALAATVKDNGGLTLSGVSVTFTITPAGGAGATFPGSALTATVFTDSNGVATAPTLTANTTIGSFTVTANLTAPATPLAPAATFNLTNQPGVATSLVVTTASTTLVAGTATDITVKAVDANGNTATGYTGTVLFTSSDPLATAGGGLPANYTFTGSDNGVHTFTNGVTLKTAGTAQFVKATDNQTASITGQQSTITVTPGTAKIVIAYAGTTPQSAQVGHAFTTALKVTVTDAFNNPVGAGTTVTYTVPGSGASGSFTSGTTATTDATGIATPTAFTANANAGTYSVTASVAGGTTSATFNLTNTTGAPGSITASSGTPQTASVNGTFAAPLVALVKDGSGNPVGAGVSITFTLVPATNGASATFVTSATPTTDANGTARVTVKANTTPGTYQITASATGVGAAAVFQLTNAPGSATQLKVELVGGTGAKTTAARPKATGNTMTFTVTALDQFNNVATGYTGTVHFTSNDPNATLPPDATFTAADHGVKTVTVTFSTSGANTLSATDINNGSIKGSFSVTPATVTKVAVASSTTMKAGGQAQLTATATFSNSTTQDMTATATWSSSDANIASVDASGKVTAKAPGTATITATVNGVAGNATVTVTAGTPVGVAPAPAPSGRPGSTGTTPPTGTAPPAPNPAPTPRAG